MRLLLIAGMMLATATSAAAQAQMPDPSAMAGIPRPTTDLPAGTMSVRVIRGELSNNLPGETVEFTIDGVVETRTTDEQGRVFVEGLAPGTRLTAVAVVDGERLVSQEAVMGTQGIAMLLVATDPERLAREAEDRRLAESDPIRGTVVLGPESSIHVDLSEDRLTIYYVLQILNSSRLPVEIGGPLIFDLPRAARSAVVIDGSSPQATANGNRVIITGPFAPGQTNVQVAYEMPTAGGRAEVVQRFPATLQQLTVFATQTGTLEIQSDRIREKEAFSRQGVPVLLARGSTIPSGETLTMEISGLPYHARWPRYVALSLAAVFVSLGVWGAAVRPRRAA